MKSHLVIEKNLLKKEEQLAWKMAQLAEHRAELDSDAVGMVINRIIDNAASGASFRTNYRPKKTSTFAIKIKWEG